MALAPYKRLALRWQPSQKEDRIFLLIATLCLVLFALVGIYIATLDVPTKERRQAVEVPERVAKFISQKKKPPKVEPPKPKPKPKPPVKPPEPENKPEPKVKVVRERPKKDDKPLTDQQQKARDKAAQSGLMAHLSELNDLVDTSDVSAQVTASIKKGDGGQAKAGHNSTDVLTANTRKDSGGVDSGRYATQVGETELATTELASAQNALSQSAEAFSHIEDNPNGGKARQRSEEDITLVFDRQKSQLQNLYNRARRSNPLLKGKVILELVVLPDGSVKSVKVISSELNDSGLVSRILARVRNFNFGARDVEVATITYPIEFLPR